MRAPAIILAFLTLSGCSDQASRNHKEVYSKDSVIETKISPHKTIIDSLEFFAAVKKLEDIQFFIAGQDSAVVTEDPTELNELSTTKNAFHNPFAKSKSGLAKFMTVKIVRKYRVKRKDGQAGARPSANIIQLTFKDSNEASEWFNVYDRSPLKQGIQTKPKTELWSDGIHVYFVQTYHTPQRNYVDLLKKQIIENLKK